MPVFLVDISSFIKKLTIFFTRAVYKTPLMWYNLL